MPKHELHNLGSHTFEHLVNTLALRVLGAGHTGFGPGSDGGRDGLFEGEAPYPSETDRWNGTWYIQSKFHAPHLSKDPQKWLLAQIKEELEAFSKPNSKRAWPDNWIIASNIDPSGVPRTGCFDKARDLVLAARPELVERFDIWGGQKIIDYLHLYSDVARQYGHFITPGHVLAAVIQDLQDKTAPIERVLRALVVKELVNCQHSKLEQAGAAFDARPGIAETFIDLPFHGRRHNVKGNVIQHLAQSASKSHAIDTSAPSTKDWKMWQQHPSRARVLFVRGGPGQGKSTICQFFCQVLRASHILDEASPFEVTRDQRIIAEAIKTRAQNDGVWQSTPRIPILINLQQYAQWLTKATEGRGLLTYLADQLSSQIEDIVTPALLRRALRKQSWFVGIDGLDEVPTDRKQAVAEHVLSFLDMDIVELGADVLVLCTSRPQGYSGEFNALDGPTLDLEHLSAKEALNCARPIVSFGRTIEETARSVEILEKAIRSSAIEELMSTPLQCHIMAVVVRDGGNPPDRKWKLYSKFYDTIHQRETNKTTSNTALGHLFRDNANLLRALHNKVGFYLHALAETSDGANTSLPRDVFEQLARQTVDDHLHDESGDVLRALLKAAELRLVLLSTPDDGNNLRFDIRPLQEFFAAEFLYSGVASEQIRNRLECIAGDVHWRETVHFLLSALIEQNRATDLAVALAVVLELDNGNGPAELGTMRKHRATGAVIAARLLEEGVAEQDRRIRGQLKPILSSLAATTDTRTLRPLSHITQPQTRSWLMTMWMEQLRTLTAVESVGAFRLLVLNTKQEDEEVVEFIYSYIENTSESAWALRDVFIPRPTNSENQWMLPFAIQTLTSTSAKSPWPATQFAYRGVRAFLSRTRPAHFPEVWALSAREQLLLSASTRLGSRKSRETFDFGSCSLEAPIDDCFSPDTEAQWAVLPNDNGPRQVRGYFRFLEVMLNFITAPCPISLSAVFAAATAWDVPARFLCPAALRTYLPHFTTMEGLEAPNAMVQVALSGSSESEFQNSLKTGRMGELRVERQFQLGLYGHRIQKVTGFKAILEMAPTRALEVLCSSSEVDEGFIEAASLACLNRPSLLGNSAASWGLLLSQRNRSLAAKIRLILGSLRGDCFNHHHDPGGVFPFELDLPKESGLLFPIAQLLVDQLSAPGPKSGQSWKRVSNATIEYVSSHQQLEKIATNLDIEFAARFGAGLLLIMHPHAGFQSLSATTPLFLSREAVRHVWMLAVILRHCSGVGNRAAQLVNSLLATYPQERHLRASLDSTLAAWRELSHSPVTTAQTRDQWLTE
tara:strand:+ start:271 stop:4170 length:3900 start_codon:yes stop_codon:yes gene_type:complete